MSQPLISFSQAIMDLVFKSHHVWKWKGPKNGWILNQVPRNKMRFLWLPTYYICNMCLLTANYGRPTTKLMIVGSSWLMSPLAHSPCAMPESQQQTGCVPLPIRKWSLHTLKWKNEFHWQLYKMPVSWIFYNKFQSNSLCFHYKFLLLHLKFVFWVSVLWVC